MISLGSVVWGIVYTVVFADTAKERWRNFGISAAMVALAASVFLALYLVEWRRPFSLATRRLLWAAMLAMYVGWGLWLLRMLGSPLVPRSQVLYSLAKLGVLLPVAVILVHLLGKRNDEQT